ncbi:MAG: hypothetical protein ACJ8AN_16335 [Archangium sp.]
MSDAYKPPVLLTLGYFLLSFFAAGSIALGLADILTRGMSNFEGGRGIAAANQVLFWFMPALMGLWAVYLWVRKTDIRAISATFALGVTALPSLIMLTKILF